MFTFRFSVVVIFLSFCSLSVFADTGSSLNFLDQKSLLESDFQSLKIDLSSDTTDNNTLDLLQCMQIPFPVDDPAYTTILQELESDFIRDFSSVVDDASVSDFVRLNFYTTSLSSLKTSLQKDRDARQLVIDNIVVQNQSFFDQINTDKELLEGLVAEYNLLSSEISMYKVKHGYSLSQYVDMTSQYRQILFDNLDRNLERIKLAYVNKRSDYIGFEDFAQEKKEQYLQDLSSDIKVFFNTKVANILDISFMEEYERQIVAIDKSFYQNDNLQCSLLVELTQENRTFYEKLLMEISEQRSLLHSTFSSNSTEAENQESVLDYNDFLSDLKSWYSNLLLKYTTAYIQDLRDHSSLLLKATRGEKRSLNELRILIKKYDESTSENRNIIKSQILAQISILEKNDIISKRVQDSINIMKKDFEPRKRRFPRINRK